MNKLFTSESVTEGHPDKLCDYVSDAVLDACLEQDPNSRVAIETQVKTVIDPLGTHHYLNLAGELTTRAKLDLRRVARKALQDLGYDADEKGFNYQTANINLHISPQSPDIDIGVSARENKEQGAGDQGLMFGCAVRHTPELLPLPIALAHRLTKALRDFRVTNGHFLRPDGKSQVTVEFEKNIPKRVDAVVLSAHHSSDIAIEDLRSVLHQKVILPTLGTYLDAHTKIFINPTGKFEIGGPLGDSGVTGRKIIVDTYGGWAPHGGGAFSGKDPSKVDRSAAYAARWVAKNVVAAGLADECIVQLAYAIGVAQPVSVYVNTNGTQKIPEEKIASLIQEHFDLRPRAIIEQLQLLRPIYRKTVNYGHFGREEPEFTWEKTDKAEELREEVGLQQ
ncbi:MAG TPA: methionine adenosyltransferase [Candidatus Nanoarchaeia archaeon]|nr:methionine adenosyltransferase [Candidatus Nanoarchaeia archaeon]